MFALAHMWFDDGSEAPLGRTRRAFYYQPFGENEVKERTVRMLQIPPDAEGEPITDEASELLEDRRTIEGYLDDRLSSIRATQKKGEFEQGEAFSKEQETLIQYLQHLRDNSSDELSRRAEKLRKRLNDVKLENTDEDRILRERFRGHQEYNRLPDWPIEELLDEIEEYLDEVISESTEYQETLVKADDVHARLLCWGIVGTS